MKMKTVAIVASALAVSALGACSQSPEEAAGDLAEQQMESQEDVLQEEADLAGAMGEAQEDALDEQADAVGDAAGEAGEAAEESVAPAE